MSFLQNDPYNKNRMDKSLFQHSFVKTNLHIYPDRI